MTECQWREGPVPLRLDGARIRLPLLEAEPGAALLRFPDVGRFLLRPGRDPVAHLVRPGAVRSETAFLTHPLAALQSLLDGEFSFRASAVRVADGAAVVSGPLGSSGPTLSALLVARGFDRVADEVVTCVGTANRVRARMSDLSPDPSLPARPALSTHAHRKAAAESGCDIWSSGSLTLPLRRIVHVTMRRLPEQQEVYQLNRHQKLAYCLDMCWYKPLIPALGLSEAHFAWATAITSAPVTYLSLDSRNTERLDDLLVGCVNDG